MHESWAMIVRGCRLGGGRRKLRAPVDMCVRRLPLRLWCQMTLSNSDVSEEISELISEVGERYGIGSLITARRLTGGYANDVFRLDADGPPTVLHLKHPPVDADSLNWEHRLLAQLNKHLPEALARCRLLMAQPGSGFTPAPFG